MNIQTRLQNKILTFRDPTTELLKKDVHGIIQHMAKAKKGSTIINGFELDGQILTSNALQRELFKNVNKKFNPMNLKHKIIQSDGIQVTFQEF